MSCSGDQKYTREWIDAAGGLPSCNKCKIHFGGDYFVPTGYFDRPCENFNIDLSTSEKVLIPLSERVLCGGTWGIWPEGDPYAKYIEDNGEKSEMRVFSFDSKGKLIRKFETPCGFSLEKFFRTNLGCFDSQFLCREPIIVVNLTSRNDGKIIFTFVCFKQ